MVQHRTRRNMRRGGGWAQGPPLTKNAYYVPEYTSYSDCYDQARPGSIQSNPDPAKAQTPMAGGVSRRSTRRATRGGGCGCMLGRGGGRRRGAARRGGGSRRSKRGGGCGYVMTRGGSRRTRRQRGGRYGFDVSQSIGGDGPNVAPLIPHVPCEGHRPMPLNPTSAGMLASAPDPDVMVSGLRPGSAMFGGGAPAGEHPLAYTAPRAGYSFLPNISQGQTLNPGQIPYQEVVPQAAPCASSTCGQAIAAINK
jgi:hypothetical protein